MAGSGEQWWASLYDVLAGEWAACLDAEARRLEPKAAAASKEQLAEWMQAGWEAAEQLTTRPRDRRLRLAGVSNSNTSVIASGAPS